jgi:serine/threonine-protein kinase
VGTLRLVVRGWAHIYVDGQEKGKVPPTNELELPAGKHQLMLVNPARKPYRATVRIRPGQTLEHRVKFSEEP